MYAHLVSLCQKTWAWGKKKCEQGARLLLCTIWVMHLLEMEGKIPIGVTTACIFQLSEQRGYGPRLPTGTVGEKFSPALAPVNVEFGHLMKGASMTWLPANVRDSVTQELPSMSLTLRSD